MSDKALAVVTGASSGIGYQTALELASVGYEVIAVARRSDRLHELKSKNSNIIPVVLDVTKDLTPLVQAIADRPVAVLVNNAGGALGRDDLLHAKKSHLQTMIDVNLTALVFVTQELMPFLLKAPHADIVNIGSIAGREYYGGAAVYCAVKAGVEAFSKALREDVLGQAVRVSCVCPGLVETEFSLVRFEGDANKAKAVYAGLKPLTAHDVAQTVTWILKMPPHVCIENIVMMPTAQANVWRIHRQEELK